MVLSSATLTCDPIHLSKLKSEHFFIKVSFINFLLLSFRPYFFSAQGYTEVLNLIEKAADVSEAFAQHQAG